MSLQQGQSSLRETLLEIFVRLYDRFGYMDWWPRESDFEVVVGAILTQNTNWSNVKKALENLKDADLLSVERINKLEKDQLIKHILPAGYYNAKARKLKEFTGFLYREFNGSLDELFELPVDELREKLLSIWGIGEETADSIILYAAKKPTFVIDAYTRRILSRLGLCESNISYKGLQSLFIDNLPQGIRLYYEYHALLVRCAQQHCRKNPLCEGCPLSPICRYEDKIQSMC